MNQPLIFMLLLLAVGFFAKNQTLMIAVAVLLVIHYSGFGNSVLPYIQSKGIQIGVTIITIAVLVPIMTGDIGLRDLQEAMGSSYAWIALVSGIFVAVIAANGIDLLQSDPHITVALVFGTILAVAVFGGVAVGPVIGAGIAYLAMRIVEFFSTLGG
ncbi:DUF441 domain-containing protein [Alkalicoccus daliensis]|uniref:UPF0756 membrane protein SAMN04488053_10250 n=1 Tax=Alkalicoccus daliensis TaxID=745820 RepID=A0A1H0CD07_9BACI|nr:DUF441 domain-containing protein [Alkalicoccus daliensis]SDN55759.1 Uncharacterized membrane protein, DUF441 family [Alkalicoccus daliensis]